MATKGTARNHSFVSPSLLHEIATCRKWSLADVRGDGNTVTLDLRRWRSINPTALIGLTCITARLHRIDGREVTIRIPQDDYARRMLATVEWVAALDTFAANLVTVGEPPHPVQRLLPLIPVTPFKTAAEVELMTQRFAEEISGSVLACSQLRLRSRLNLALDEAANNVLHHSRSPLGGFAVVQMRRMTRQGKKRRFIEICVGDPGRGIAESFGMTDDAAAIERALRSGMSSTSDPHRGYGLPHIEELATEHQLRALTIHSGAGYVTRMYGQEPRFESRPENPFGGTLISVYVPCRIVSDLQIGMTQSSLILPTVVSPVDD